MTGEFYVLGIDVVTPKTTCNGINNLAHKYFP